MEFSSHRTFEVALFRPLQRQSVSPDEAIASQRTLTVHTDCGSAVGSAHGAK